MVASLGLGSKTLRVGCLERLLYMNFCPPEPRLLRQRGLGYSFDVFIDAAMVALPDTRFLLIRINESQRLPNLSAPVSALISGAVDLVPHFLHLSKQRTHLIDFVLPSLDQTIYTYVINPPAPLPIFPILSPFSAPVWVLGGLLYLLIALIITKLFHHPLLQMHDWAFRLRSDPTRLPPEERDGRAFSFEQKNRRRFQPQPLAAFLVSLWAMCSRLAILRLV